MSNFALRITVQPWRDARVAEEARLESVYTSKLVRGFESPSLRRKRKSLVAVSFSFWLIFNTLRSQSSDIHPIKGGISEKCGLLSLVIIR